MFHIDGNAHAILFKNLTNLSYKMRRKCSTMNRAINLDKIVKNNAIRKLMNKPNDYTIAMIPGTSASLRNLGSSTLLMINILYVLVMIAIPVPWKLLNI